MVDQALSSISWIDPYRKFIPHTDTMAAVGRTQLSKLQVAPSIWIIIGPILLLGALAVLLPVLVRTGKRPPDNAWRGIFYSNPDDPALLVPKRFGVGYTLNFGNPWSWAVLAMIFLIVALPFILSAVAMRHMSR
jgi:hypothetical protein